MFLGKRPSQLVVYSAQTITAYTDHRAKPISRRFPHDFILHQEVVAPEQLLNSLTAFFREIKLNRKTLVLLSNDVAFHKQFSPPITSETDPRIQMFLDEVPFLREQISMKILTKNGVSSIMATNRETPQTIANAINAAGGKYAGTVPMLAFATKFHDQLTSDEVSNILSNISTQVAADIVADNKRTSRAQIILLWILVLLLIACIGVLGSKFITTLPPLILGISSR